MSSMIKERKDSDAGRKKGLASPLQAIHHKFPSKRQESSMENEGDTSKDDSVITNDAPKSKTERKVSRKHLNEGFNIDSIPKSKKSHSSLVTPEPDSVPVSASTPKGSLKNVGELANLLLDMKKSLMLDSNIDPNLIPQNYTSHNKTNDSNRIHISRSTLSRAERVKTMLSIFYISLERIHDWRENNDITYPGVEDVYNPLQIIRNRKLRKKYHEYPKPLSFKPIPLASQVFSNKGKKLIWQVEIHEIMGDITWRPLHWHELKNPKGEFWFPATPHKRLHDKLFDDVDMNVYEHAITDDQGLLLPPSHSRVPSNAYSIQRSLYTAPSEGTTDDENTRFRNHNRGSSTYSAERSRSTSRLRDKASLKLTKLSTPSKFFKKTNSDSPSSSSNEIKDDYFTNESENVSSKYKFPSHENLLSPKPVVRVENEPGSAEGIHILRDVAIEPLDHKRAASVSSNISTNPNFNSSTGTSASNNYILSSSQINNPSRSGSVESEETKKLIKESLEREKLIKTFDAEDVKLYDYMKRLKAIRFKSDLCLHNLEMKPNQIERFLNSKPIGVFNSKLYENFDMIDNNLLPRYNSLFEGYNNEAEAIRKDLLNNHSAKIDTLLSVSDRAIGELNTSNTLELRKLNERLERLDSSNLTSTGLSKFGYKVLENLIVVLLWAAWGIVTIYKVFRSCFRFVYSILKLIFGFN